jgi:hypothetical protein
VPAVLNIHTGVESSDRGVVLVGQVKTYCVRS